MSAIEIVLPGELLAIDPGASGFAHGFGLFETVRLRDGRLELWEAHWQRLARSARELGVACPYKREEVFQGVRTLAGKLAGDAAIKLSLLKEGKSSRLLGYSRPISRLPADIGVLMDAPTPINESSPLAGHKTHNYLENLLTLEVAREAGCFDGLRLNRNGHLVEGAVSNVFFYREGYWHTPGLKTGLLPGVIREVLVQALAAKEGSYQPADLFAADAAFLTNSLIGLQPVDWLSANGRKIQLRSRAHNCFQHAEDLLADKIEATSIPI